MSNPVAESFLKLTGIMNELREKCPWDRKQTISSLRQQTIEETFELADSISDENWHGIKEELGDLLLHVLFYAKIGEEQERFSLQEVIDGISSKLISRHPHIYGDVMVRDEQEVSRNWEKLKLKEGKTSVLSGVPRSLPATVKAMRLQEKAKQVGFEWENKEQVYEKVEEELGELQEAVELDDREKKEDEFGDVVFSLINYARFLQIDAEHALEKTNKKFISRFTRMEEIAAQGGKLLHNLTLSEMDAIWNEVKMQNSSH
ncbi:MAG TPA: nucleoside triphosphate pyrophosphohydrolase [Chitinophagaceae bacterium]|nr:nucleoside triphosphate pyrophosphohydrolase [Chitinophagaceae bacterium]